MGIRAGCLSGGLAGVKVKGQLPAGPHKPLTVPVLILLDL